MMSVALLIMSSRAPQIAQRLAAYFPDGRFNLYFHVDAKTDLAAYKDVVGHHPNVRFVSDRQSVYWGGFNMIRATFAMAEMALGDPANGAFVLISDDSFPLYSPDILYAILAGHPSSWMTCWRVAENHEFHNRYNNFFYFDSGLSSARFLPIIDRRYVPEAGKDIAELNELQIRGKKPLAALYAGKQWWALKRPHLEAILALHHSDQHLRESFRFSAIPDELYCQTLFRMAFPEEVLHDTPMYDDFSRDPKPFVYKSLDELSPTRVKQHLFVRKVGSVELADQLAETARERDEAVLAQSEMDEAIG